MKFKIGKCYKRIMDRSLTSKRQGSIPYNYQYLQCKKINTKDVYIVFNALTVNHLYTKDGSLYETYYHFRTRIKLSFAEEKYLEEITNNEFENVVRLALMDMHKIILKGKNNGTNKR